MFKITSVDNCLRKFTCKGKEYHAKHLEKAFFPGEWHWEVYVVVQDFPGATCLELVGAFGSWKKITTYFKK